MPAKVGYKNTGKNSGQHKGGRGDYKGKTKPMYPYGPERVSSTKQSPNYPRSNFSGGRNKSGSKSGY